MTISPSFMIFSGLRTIEDVRRDSVPINPNEIAQRESKASPNQLDSLKTRLNGRICDPFRDFSGRRLPQLLRCTTTLKEDFTKLTVRCQSSGIHDIDKTRAVSVRDHAPSNTTILHCQFGRPQKHR